MATVAFVAMPLPAIAQTSATTMPVPKPAASLLSQPVFSLSQVHRGLHGTAYTVFEGSTPEPIDVEILGVLRDAIGPGKDMILARLVGGKAEYDGVVDGMSGSPVYIDGKLLGAIGYRIGQFTKQPIAGITPIEQMLDVIQAGDRKYLAYDPSDDRASLDSASGYRSNPRSAALVTGALSTQSSDELTIGNKNGAMLQPIDTPLVFDGFSPAAIDLFQRRLHSLGMVPVSGLGGADPGAADSAPIVPGSAISAIIVSGDFNMSATCTVTYVDPKQLLACGHPITRYGNISLPMSKAVVVATVASPLSPMKIVNTTQTVGSFTADRASGILGIFGQPTRMIPVSLAIHGAVRSHTYHFAIAEHPRLTPGALIASVYQAMQDTNSYDDPSTYDVHGTIQVAGYPAVQIDQRIASTDQSPSSLAAAVAIAGRFDAIFGNPGEMPKIEFVSLTLSATPGRHSATLADAYALTPTVHAGQRLTIEATLHPYRLPARVLRVPIQLPATLAPGPVRLLVSDGTTLDHTLRLVPSPTAPPIGLGQTIARLNRLHATDRLYVTLLAPVPQATSDGQILPAVPLSMANILQPGTNGAGFTIDGETAVPLAAQPVDLALSGSRVVTVNVRP